MAKSLYRCNGTLLRVPTGLGYPDEGRLWRGVEICCPGWPVGYYCEHCPAVEDEPGSVYTPRYYDVTFDVQYTGVTVTGDGSSAAGSPNHAGYIKWFHSYPDWVYAWPAEGVAGWRVWYDAGDDKFYLGWTDTPSSPTGTAYWERAGAGGPNGDYSPIAGSGATGTANVSAEGTFDYPFVGATFKCDNFAGETACEWFGGPLFYNGVGYAARVIFSATQIEVRVGSGLLIVDDTVDKVCRSGFTTAHATVEIGAGP